LRHSAEYAWDPYARTSVEELDHVTTRVIRVTTSTTITTMRSATIQKQAKVNYTAVQYMTI